MKVDKMLEGASLKIKFQHINGDGNKVNTTKTLRNLDDTASADNVAKAGDAIASLIKYTKTGMIKQTVTDMTAQ